MSFSIRHQDDSAKFHVDARSEERRCHQDKNNINDIRRQCPVRRLLARHSTSNVSDHLNCTNLVLVIIISAKTATDKRLR